MRTCLYEGVVWHRRLTPVMHAFRFPLFMVHVDLEELPQAFGRFGGWSARWPAIARFRRSDYLGDVKQPLDVEVRDLVERRTGKRPTGGITLLTNFRYFGFGMNPVSFYYCFDDSNTRVTTLVAEVTNTPWNEKHCYVIDLDSSPSPKAGGLRAHALAESNTDPSIDALRPRESPRLMLARNFKEFHVSPFLPMEMEYRWRVSQPGERLYVSIENFRDNTKQFDATLSLRRLTLSRARLAWILIKYPLLTLRVFLGIYWHALRLWIKGVPFVPHPPHGIAPRSEQTPVFSPTPSARP